MIIILVTIILSIISIFLILLVITAIFQIKELENELESKKKQLWEYQKRDMQNDWEEVSKLFSKG